MVNRAISAAAGSANLVQFSNQSGFKQRARGSKSNRMLRFVVEQIVQPIAFSRCLHFRSINLHLGFRKPTFQFGQITIAKTTHRSWIHYEQVLHRTDLKHLFIECSGTGGPTMGCPIYHFRNIVSEQMILETDAEVCQSAGRLP